MPVITQLPGEERPAIREMLKSALAAAAAAAAGVTEQANTPCQLWRLAFCTFDRFITTFSAATMIDGSAVFLPNKNLWMDTFDVIISLVTFVIFSLIFSSSLTIQSKSCQLPYDLS